MAFSYKDYTASDTVKKYKDLAEQYATYKEAQSVIDAREQMKNQEANKVGDWTGGTYGQSLKDALDKIANREKFTYDLNGDALYQQYKNQYMQLGKLAMADTMGQASALTGGYGNSYASTAGNQAYQQYLSRLNDKVPDLYNLALQKYQMEGDQLKDIYSMYNDQYNTEYGQYRDQVADWRAEMDRLQQKYYNEADMDWSRFSSNRDYYANQYNNERNFDYGVYSDAKNIAYNDYALQQQLARSGGGSRSSRSGRVTATPPTNDGNTQNAQNYLAKLMTPAQQASWNRNEVRNGSPSTSYAEYVKQEVAYWGKTGKITEAEGKAILKAKGIN